MLFHSALPLEQCRLLRRALRESGRSEAELATYLDRTERTVTDWLAGRCHIGHAAYICAAKWLEAPWMLDVYVADCGWQVAERDRDLEEVKAHYQNEIGRLLEAQAALRQALERVDQAAASMSRRARVDGMVEG